MFGTKHSKACLIDKDHRVHNTWTEYKILVLKYANVNITK